MHPVSTEFGTIKENITLADDWGIVMGASHTEAMNRNNVGWPALNEGPWRYDTNRDNVYKYWESGPNSAAHTKPSGRSASAAFTIRPCKGRRTCRAK